MSIKEKKTHVVNLRCDVRNLATIASYYYGEKLEQKMPNSSLLSRAISDFAHSLTLQTEAKTFTTTSSALKYLRQMGIFKDSEIAKRNIKLALEEEDRKGIVQPESGVDFEALAREMEGNNE